MSRGESSSMQLVSSLMFRLLPLQVLLAIVAVLNDIISSLFASNFVGAAAMAAIGLYSPITILVFAIGMLFAAGSQLLSSKYMGKHQIDHTQAVFTLNIIVTFIIGAILAASHVLVILSGLTDALSDDPVVAVYLDQYLLGKAIGVLPLMLSMQLSAFLSVENQMRRTSIAGSFSSSPILPSTYCS